MLASQPVFESHSEELLDLPIRCGKHHSIGHPVLRAIAAAIELLGSNNDSRVRQRAEEERERRLAQECKISLDVRLAERARIARELHDTLLQSFNGLLLRFQTVSDLLPTRPAEARDMLTGAIELANKAIVEGREAVEGLRSPARESNDLVLAVRLLGEEFAGAYGEPQATAFHVDVKGTSRPLRPIVCDEFYRIAREALLNAFRHSKGTKIDAEFHYNDAQLRLRIRDNGRGIDARVLAEAAQRGHYGLTGMRERAELIGGRLTVWSAPDRGTKIECNLRSSLAYAAARARRATGPLTLRNTSQP